MRTLLCALLLVAVASMCEASKPHYDLKDAPKLFEKFIKDYKRVYKNAKDREVHYQAFVKSLEGINKFNDDPANTATFDINYMADYTEEEMKKRKGLGSKKP